MYTVGLKIRSTVFVHTKTGAKQFTVLVTKHNGALEAMPFSTLL